MIDVQTTTSLRPLTRPNGATGQPFKRDPGVEAQISEALLLDPSLLRARAKIRDRGNPGFLQEECLVYLVREYSRDATMRHLGSDIAGELLTRIEGYLGRELRRLGPEHYEEASDEVVATLFGKITDQGSDVGDFAQVSFWTFLAAKVSDAYRKHLRLLKKEQAQVAPAWVHGSEPPGEGDGQGEGYQKEPAAGPSLERAVLTEELLGTLTGHHLTAMKLHLAGWPIESKHETEATISRYFGRTPRTINNWLREAQRILKEAYGRDEA